MTRSLLFLGLLAACRPAPVAQPAPSEDLKLEVAALEQRVNMLEKLLAGGGGQADGGAPLPADSAARVSRVEGQVNKILAFLRQAVPPQLDTAQVYAMPIDPLDPVLGPPDAAVTMVEAFEFLCPYCSMLEPTIERLRKEYPTSLRVVSKYMIIHGEPAIPPGLAGCAAARQGKYGPMQAALWAAIWPEEGSPDRSAAEPSALEGSAKSAGLDLKKYKADVADAGPCRAWMEASGALLERFGVSGTPTVLINGRVIESRDYDALKAAIDAELAAVKTSGVASGKYYKDVVMARGKSEAVMISPFD